jgi:protease-4
MEKQTSVSKRVFNGIFTVINVSRKVIINLVFFTVLLIFFLLLTKEKETVEVPNNTALVFNPQGDIVEQAHEINPVDKFLNEAMDQPDDNPEVLLSDILKVLKTAQDDDRIKVLVLNLSNIGQSGLTKLRIIAKAITEFKASGKEIIAVADGYTQNQYYLASYADKIWLNNRGWVLLDGYGRYPLYFKSALDKLKISQHIFRVGTFKSAVEPYMRDNMSPAAKEANKLWLDDLWTQYKTDVAEQRGFSIDNFDESSKVLIQKLNQANGNIAEYALANHWVDALKTREQMRSELIELVGKDKKKKDFNHISFNDYLTAIKQPTLESLTAAQEAETKDKVAIIVAKGTILDGTQKPGNIGGDSTAKLLRQARENDSVKAVVLRVDSPGGSAFASEIIRQEVELLKQAGKPVIASMGTYAASGGYWISAPADAIIAEPTTITGSIGIFGMLMTVENSLADLGIHTDGVGTTDIAGFNLTRPLTEDMASLFQLSINRGYQDFLTLVAENRHMTLAEVDAIAQGRVWTGRKAKELGLVDRLGDLNDAITLAAEKAKLEQYDTLLVEQELSARDKFLQNLFAEDSKFAALVLPQQTIETSVLAGNSQVTHSFNHILNSLKQQFTQLATFNDPQGMYTLCEACELTN